MISISPVKILIVLVVGLLVLGPDKLPGIARQIGSAWGDLRRLRQKLEQEVRGAFPDLPPTYKVAQAVRSPLSLLDELADAQEREKSRTAADQSAVDHQNGERPAVEPHDEVAPVGQSMGRLEAELQDDGDAAPGEQSVADLHVEEQPGAKRRNGVHEGAGGQSGEQGRVASEGSTVASPYVAIARRELDGLPDDPTLN